MTTTLAVNNLSMNRGGRVVIHGLSLTIEPGTITAVVGNNGSGKTTLLDILTGYQRPAYGSVTFQGLNLLRFRPYQIARMGIARTFQDGRSIRGVSVGENVLLASGMGWDGKINCEQLRCRNIFWDRSEVRRTLDSILGHYSLLNQADRPATTLSVGQSKLLSLACCLSRKAAHYLLDEPVAALSHTHTEAVEVTLKKLRDAGAGVLVVEHRHEFVSRVADQVYVMEEGSLRLGLPKLPATQGAPRRGVGGDMP